MLPVRPEVAGRSALSDSDHEDRQDACHQQPYDQHLRKHQRYPRSRAPPNRKASRAIERDCPCRENQNKNLSNIPTS